MIRFLTISAFALWIGGLTFYALFVIPEGKHVFGSHTAQGFVTQRVTNSLNISGVVALVILFCNWWSTRGLERRSRLALPTWITMACSQALLFPLHSSLDLMLDYQERMVLDGAAFYSSHRIYLLLSGLIWISAFVHLAAIIDAWKREDSM